MSLISNTGTLTIAAASVGLPTWRQAMTIGTWGQISGTALSSCPISVQTWPGLGNTGPSSKVTAWTGFAIDTRDSSIYSTANGGHQDYAGNEIDRLRLSDNAPAWVEVKPSSPSSAIPTIASQINQPYYSDGRPVARHTYTGTTVNEVSNKLMLFTGSGWGNQGGALASSDSFNLSTNAWDAAGTVPAPGSDFTNALGWTWVDDKTTGDVYGLGNFTMHRIRGATNTSLGSGGCYGQWTAAARDTTRNRILYVGGFNVDHHVYDIAANTMTAVTLSGPNAGDILTSNEGYGMVFVPALDVFLVRNDSAGGTVYRINASTWSVDTLTTSGGSGIPAGHLVWRKWLYAPALGGVFYIPDYTSNCWFLPLHIPTSYTTSFSTVQNPLSESGKWITGRTGSNAWNDCKVIAVSGGNACVGVVDIGNDGHGNQRYADDIAQVATTVATFPANQFAQAVLYRQAGYNGNGGSHECELFLRMAITSGNARGYEVSIGINPAGGFPVYAFIVRWEGAAGVYTVLSDPHGGIGSYNNTPTTPADGDTWRAEIVGTTIRAYQNGRLILTVTDGSVVSGQPGLGFWPADGATHDSMGWRSYMAGSL